MEPQYMMLGHAAGIAAKLSIRDGKGVQEISVPELQKMLLDQGAVFEYVQSPQDRAHQILFKLTQPPQMSTDRER